MNFEQLLAGAIHHRKTKDARRHRMDMQRDSARHSRNSSLQSQMNRQRFAQQQHLQSRSQEHQMLRQQQQQHFQQQQQQQQEDAEAAQIDSDINAVREKRRRDEISVEEERTLLWKLENKKRGLQTAGGPPPETPKYVGTDQDIGDSWEAETDELKPDGTPWKITYSRTNRGDKTILRDEKKEWTDREKDRREWDLKQAQEARALAAEGRAQQEAERKAAAEERRLQIESDRQAGESRKIEAETRDKEASTRAEKTESRTQITSQLKDRANRKAKTGLRQKYNDIMDEDLNRAKRQSKLRAAGISDMEGPTKEDIDAEEARLLDEYLTDEEAASGRDDLAQQGVPFNADAGMFEVTV